MSIFATPDWEPNAIGDERSKDLFNLGTLEKKTLMRQLKKQKLKEKVRKENDKEKLGKDQKVVTKESGKQKLSPLVRIRTEGKQKIKTKRKKNVQNMKISWTDEARLKVCDKATEQKQNESENTFDSDYKAQRNNVKRKLSPLVRIRTEGKQKMKTKQKKNVQKMKISQTDEAHLKLCDKATEQKQNESENNFDSDYKAQRNNVKPKLDNPRIGKFKEKFLNLRAPLITSCKKSKNLTLRQRMLERLKASRFRFLNESMYTSTGKEAENYFQKDPNSFKAYHDGFKQQVSRWPLNPLDIIIKSIKKLPESYITADFGCGDARLAQSVKCKVHSFDLVAINEHVTACNMANVSLENESVDVAVFCLSLMGTNLRDYIVEANRVLKMGGALKIIEVESRFDNVDAFIKDIQHFGFSKTRKDMSHDLFYFIEFKKSANCKQKHKLPEINLHPCLYKKR